MGGRVDGWVGGGGGVVIKRLPFSLFLSMLKIMYTVPLIPNTPLSPRETVFFFPVEILVLVAILKKVPVAGQECAWQYSKIAQNARASTKLGKIARGKFEKSARATQKNGKLPFIICHGHFFGVHGPFSQIRHVKF